MVSNREIEKLFQQWNPNNIHAGDRVVVSISRDKYQARVVGLDLDIKNQKVYANLKLVEKSTRSRPTRVDAADCYKVANILYRGHHGDQ